MAALPENQIFCCTNRVATARSKTKSAFPSEFSNRSGSIRKPNCTFDPSISGALLLDLFARLNGETVTIGVRDTGPGIDAESVEVVNAGHETKLTHNLGLGLWIANWITTKYGGSFSIHPYEADGTTGTEAKMTFPALDPEEPIDRVDARATTLFW